MVNSSEEALLKQLIQKHSALLKRKTSQSFSLNEAEDLLKEIRLAGRIVEDLGQRKLLQSYAGFWGLFLYENTTPSRFPLTLIEEFEEVEGEEKTYQDKILDAPVPNFYGRQKELDDLRQWILNENCRLVAISGIGGIGKTSLAFQLIEGIKNEFEYVFSLSTGQKI